jgi:GMP synthase (glutamine-hydrolysing)
MLFPFGRNQGAPSLDPVHCKDAPLDGKPCGPGDKAVSSMMGIQPGDIAVIDLGGQYCHLLTRRLRQLGIGSSIYGPDVTPAALADSAGIIMSGGPRSVSDPGAPRVDWDVTELDKPVLGVCYGHQLLATMLGGRVTSGSSEFGRSRLHVTEANPLFANTPVEQRVWMSHSDSVVSLPKNVQILASTSSCDAAAFADVQQRLYGVQFHPEVEHTEHGFTILRNFVTSICGLESRPPIATHEIDRLVARIREKVSNGSVFFLVSGGVDSTVAFTLCARALPKERVLGLYVDTGLMRAGETDELRENMRELGIESQVLIRDESNRFLSALAGVVDPEEKRRIIGRQFVEVQARAMHEHGIDPEHWFLGQGTIYPDTIESGGSTGRAAVIKTHHNRCAEIQELLDKGRVIEPLTEFYKDEVREIGRALGLSERLTNRWPFPGPGLAIRCLCIAPGQPERSAVVTLPAGFGDFEAADFPIYSVGVQGDDRTYRRVVAIRGRFDYDVLQELSSRLCNTSVVYNRIMYHLGGRDVPLAEGRVVAATLTRERIARLREADRIVRAVLEEESLTDAVWQFPVVLVPLSFGSGESIVLRPVNSEDGMTANFARLPHRALHRMTDALVAHGLADAVFLDITDKPPATIEWE